MRFGVLIVAIGLTGCGRLGFEPLDDGGGSSSIPKTDAQLQACGSGSMCRCLTGQTCNFSCPSGSCNATCDAGSTCTFDCANATSCRFDCARTANCSITCPSLQICERTPCENTSDCTVSCSRFSCSKT